MFYSWPDGRYFQCAKICTMCVVGASQFFSSVSAAEVWFSALDPVWREIRKAPTNDYMKLFDPDAPWQIVAKSVSTVELFKKFVEQGSDSDLRQVISDLQRRKIALAVQGTPLLASQACGLGVESYGPPHDMAMVAARVKNLGGSIAAVALDEPLYYGHQFDHKPLQSFEVIRPTACHASIADLAQQTARKVAEFHQVFPDGKIGDVEPIGAYESDEEFAADFAEWLDAYRTAGGAAFAFVDLDIVWWRPSWRSQLEIAVRVLKKAGIPFGIIYNGTPADQTDAAWIEDAKAHIRLVESILGMKPNRAKFQSWTDRPRKILPETAPDSFTSLVKGYVGRN